MVYSVKAVAELPLACPLTATPTARLAPPPDTPGSTTYKLRVIILLVGMIPSRTEIMLSWVNHVISCSKGPILYPQVGV